MEKIGPFVAFGWKYSNRSFHRTDQDDRYILKPYNIEEIDKVRLKKNNLDIYHTIFKYQTENKEFNRTHHLGNLFFDLDASNIDDALNEIYYLVNHLASFLHLEEDEYKIWFSGGKGFHFEVHHSALGIDTYENWSKVYKHIAYQLHQRLGLKTLDLGVYEWRRLFRIPYSIHSKTELHKNILSLDDIETKSVTEIMNMCQRSNEPYDYDFEITEDKSLIKFRRKFIDEMKVELETKIIDYNTPTKKSKNKALPFLPTCLREMKFIEGFRNKGIFQKALYFRNQGIDKKQTLAFILEDLKLQDVEYPLREVKKTIDSVWLHKHYSIGCRYNTKLKELIYNKVTKCSDYCRIKFLNLGG